MNFFKTFLASCLGSFLSLVFLVLVFIGLIGSMANEAVTEIKEPSILHLKLEKPIREMEKDNPLAGLLPDLEEEYAGLLKIKEAIAHAKEDPNITGIYLNTTQFQAGITTLQEIRASIVDFRKSGKFVIAHADYFSEGSYYVATAADKVYMNPEGMLEVNGLSSEVMFFKRMLDKLGVKAQVFRVGEFKSAVEIFIREDLSAENKLQLNEMIQSIYASMIQEMADGRRMEVEKLRAISDKMQVRLPGDAVRLGLIDSLMYDDQIESVLREKAGLGAGGSLPLVKYANYVKSYVNDGTGNEIAVIVADGDILPGKSGDGVVGSETICERVKKARESDRVKAIVIRINSPGGSAQAADEMWREIRLAADEKPVIASMGDYAASGGYYMAMAADTIVAEPTTITGSIGVFSVLFDASGLMNDKIGITTEEVKTGEVGELITISRPVTDVERAILQAQTDRIYEQFTTKAAQGRRMSVEDIRKIAGGRVWTGSQARENGLVDVLGGFDEAVGIAAKAAGLGTDYKLRYYPQPKNFFDRLKDNTEASVEAFMLERQMGEYYPLMKEISKLKRYEGVQARMEVPVVVK